MRFFLDECVSEDVCRALRPAGHECETAPNVGMSGETDDLVLAGYAGKDRGGDGVR